MISYVEARRRVAEQTGLRVRTPAVVTKFVNEALGEVLATEICCDRDYPPFDRSTRDGYAVRSAEAVAGATLRCVGEIKAGDSVTQGLAPGTCVQIMTGAAVPPGADAVVMIEFTERQGETVMFRRATLPGQNFVRKASEGRAG